MRRWIVRIAVLAALALAILALRRTVFAPKPLPVTVTVAARGRVESTVSNSRAGTVKARRRAQLSPEVGGRVLAITRREGERVRAGEVLLRLDPAVLEARLAMAGRELEAAHAQRQQSCLAAERSRRERDRLSRLAAAGVVSADQLDAATTAADTAAAACRGAGAGIAQAAAAVDLTRREIAQTVLRAPFDGVVADLAVEVGEWTTPSPPALPVPPVLDVIDPDSLYVSAPMDEVDSARIRPGQPARVTVDSYPGRSFRGQVARVAPYVLDVEAQNRTVEIEVTLAGAGPDVRLLPGTSADVEVILAARDGVLRVPTSTLIEGDRALVVEGVKMTGKKETTGKLAERRLRIGVRNWDWSEILSGLQPGDRVVTSLDRPEVKAGSEVEVVDKLPES
jgi:HlyD family secretion protein